MGFSKDLTIAGEPEDGAGLVGLYSPTSPTLWEIHPEGGPDRFRCVEPQPGPPGICSRWDCSIYVRDSTLSLDLSDDGTAVIRDREDGPNQVWIFEEA